MKKLTIPLLLFIITLGTSCEKDEITPANPNAKQEIIECRKCMEGWDITDPIP
ncbi:hypothetical protein [Daejeonella lutea]|uniref:Lipoprotein n=1 Tax=Daejeonella lutea TaxID=572036 RepID=A0A1T5AZZ8_9SPHI|nr:hypothetical protein [Daejeonella lutea]SKB40203.1 hypothetical protein SAMN05661099_1149 [Daejeonella lutea]